jgi:hypothetical protein
LQCVFLRIRIRIIASVALIPVPISGSKLKPLVFSYGPLSQAGCADPITLVDFSTFIVVILTAPWHPELQFIIRTIVLNWDVWVGASDLRLLKRHL